MKTVWFWKEPEISDQWTRAAAFSSDIYDKPSTVLSDVKPIDDLPDYELNIDESGYPIVSLIGEQFSGSPDMWYFFERTSYPTDLYAVHGVSNNAFPKGKVVYVKDIMDIKVNKSEYVGFVKWFASDSRLQQIFVSENWRRRRISTCLISVADILIVSGSMGKYLNGGDITTADGEKLREAWSQSTRLMPRVGEVKKAH